ncbi:MAG: ATP-binding protein [Candidatus Muirbacterium halophilum]|nr:ATP-binding protein [Candidatus Muirbacterium halophilum]MCK9477362.1 ATP-binding protein [Candidatus Muirbacterium halophilum]
MKKLPIGISNLEKIIKGNFVYIDKTKIALDLIDNGAGYYFLSRPRRFGKSLFLDTLKEIFQGNKDLFKELYIYDKYEWQSYNVIYLNFNEISYGNPEEFNNSLIAFLNAEAYKYSIEFKTEYVKDMFAELIRKVGCNKKAVILIDEYDKPILDNIENKEISKKIRDILKSFYSVIKDNDEYLKFVFLTGVSKFSKVSLFSGLNNLNDITIDKNYSTICGYTQSDIENKFKEHLKDQDFDKIKEWYNGYNWLGESVYNPFDILLFIQKGFVFDNYWFSTGTPTFLLKLIENNNYFLPDFDNIVADKTMLDNFDVDNIKIETLMWQTGYLTIDKVETVLDNRMYLLKIPNKEVSISMFGVLAEYITKNTTYKEYSNIILKSLLNNDFETLKTYLKTLYSSIPYNLFTKNKMYKYEGYYVSVFYSYLKALGLEIIGEDVTNKGRIDITIILPETIYIIEFKTDGKNSLEQIKEKKYHEKYIDRNKKIILLGIEFDKKERNIVKIKAEKLEK